MERAWHSRGYLPHFDVAGLVQSINFRLFDSLPRTVVHQLLEVADSRARHDKAEALLAAGHGACWLAEHDNARLVERALLHFDGLRYRLLAWCVMPNHVHVLIETLPGHPLDGVVRSWKAFTARAINRRLGRRGHVWHPDYYDRYIRDDDHLHAAIRYIEENPVAAGLVSSAERWLYSSAFRDRSLGRVPGVAGGEE